MTGACRAPAPRWGWVSLPRHEARRAELSGAGTGRFPPQPRFQPYAFYSCVRLGDSEQLKLARLRSGGCGAPPPLTVGLPPALPSPLRSWTATPTSGARTTGAARPSTSPPPTSSWTWCGARGGRKDPPSASSLLLPPALLGALQPRSLRRCQTCALGALRRAHLSSAAPHHPLLSRDRQPARRPRPHRPAPRRPPGPPRRLHGDLRVPAGAATRAQPLGQSARGSTHFAARPRRARAPTPPSSPMTSTPTWTRATTTPSTCLRTSRRCVLRGGVSLFHSVAELSAGAQPPARAGGEVQGRAQGAPPCVRDVRACGALSARRATLQMPEPHEDFGDWWTIYDYGLDTVKTWKKGCVHPSLSRSVFLPF